MRVKIKKWGNSASVRIPVAVMTAARLQVDSPVEVREEDGRIIIEPVRQSAYDLDELLKEISPENLHNEADFGLPVGNEAL